MRILIDAYEAYPVHSFGASSDKLAVEVPDETIARWTAANDAWKDAQHEMGQIYRGIVFGRREEEERSLESRLNELRKKA